MRRARFVAALTVVAVASLASAQTRRPPSSNPAGTPNTNTNVNRPPINIPDISTQQRNSRLEIQVTTDESRPLPMQVMVEIGSFSGGVIQQNYTDPEGRVSFSVPSGQQYQVKVTGMGIEPTQASVEVFAGEGFHREMIPVKFTTDAKAKLPGGVISASMLNVPVKARREFDKGMALMRKQKWAEARKHLMKATEAYPNYDWAYNNIGVVDIQMKDEAGAKEAFTRAVAINDKNPDATRNLARLKLGENDFKGAETLLQQSLTVRPDSPDTLNLLAYAQFRLREYDAALATAEKVHRGDPDRYPLAHLVAAEVREAKGDSAGARNQYEMYLKEAPDTPQAKIAKEGLARLDAQAKK